VGIDFATPLRYLPDLLNGLITTLQVTAISLALGATTGLLLALLRMSRLRAVSIPASLYIDFFRTTPILVQIVWAYFVLPGLIHVDYDIFTAAALAIGLNTGAFMAEIYRASIQAVPRGQWDAGQVLGLSRAKVFRLVVLPQAARTALPPFAATAMLTLKGTSIAAVLGVLELTKRGQLISTVTFHPFEILTVVAIIYFVVIYPISIYAAWLERRLKRSGRTAMAR
jgi:polar amino acid transport system permease protein